MTPVDKNNAVFKAIYLLMVILLPVLLYLDEHLFFIEPSLLPDLFVVAVLFILLVTIFQVARGNIFLIAALITPLLLCGVIRYCYHYGEQQGHRFTELTNKGSLRGSTHIIPGFLDNSCYEWIYYLSPGGVWLQSIATVDGCNGDCTDIEISEVKVSSPLIILKMNSCSFQNLFIRSTSGKWLGFYVPPMYEGYESSADGFALFFEDFDYNAGSYAISKYRLTPDGAEFKYVSKTLLDTPGCKEIKQIVELSKTGSSLSHYDAVMRIESAGGPCAEKYLHDFAYSSDEEGKVQSFARMALYEMKTVRSPQELAREVQMVIETRQIGDIKKLISPDADLSSISDLQKMLVSYIGARDLKVNAVPRNDMEAQSNFYGNDVPTIRVLDDRIKEYEAAGNFFSIIPLGDLVICGKPVGMNGKWSKTSVIYGGWNGKYVITFAKKKR